MTPEAQRIALAEAMGIQPETKCLNCNGEGYYGTEQDHWPCKGCNMTGVVKPFYRSPDYLGSLDTIAKAEKALLTTSQLESTYILRLQSVCMADEPRATFREAFRSAYRATAPQRAEALLRTIGKWEGE